MKDLLWDEFQEAVQEGLVRNRSILDVLSKFQEANTRVARAVVKAATYCGCIQINAQKPAVPEGITLQELKQFMDDNVTGDLCPHCREVAEEELGRMLFFMAALANVLDLNIYDILIKENKKLATLGIFHIS